eukprot:s577_g13.t1
MVALSFVAVNTVTVLVVASHLWWASSSGYQKYADIVSLMKHRRDLSTRRAQLMAEKASFKRFNVICKIYVQFSLLLNTFSALVMTNACGAHELHLLLTIALYAGCVAVAMDLVPLTPKNCDQIALWAHCLLVISLWCPSGDVEFLMMGGGRSLLRALTSILFVGNLRKALAANLVLSLGSIWSLTKAAQALQGDSWSCHVLSATLSEISCMVQVMFLVLVVRRLVDEWLELKLENLDIAGKSHARRNLLSVLVDADITLDSNLRICAPSNKAQHLLAPDLQTSLEGLKFHHLVAEADRSKLREFLNRAGYAAPSSETADLRSESSTSMQGGGSPASSMSIQMGETGRLLQIFHASIPVAEGEEMKKQPRHLVGIQEQFSAQEFSETAESNNLYMDPTTDAEQVYLSTQNLAAQQQSFEGRQRRPPSTGSRGSRDSRGSASSASSLRSSVAGLPEISSISFIFNGYSEGLSIVEATLRFDTFRGEKSSEPARLPEMRHWIRSRHWDQFRNWVQMETQRCCAGHVDEVKSFEGPLEFYYPGQPDMTLVAGSVNVMGIQNDWDSDNEDDEEQEDEETIEDVKPRHPIKILKRSLTQESAQESQPKVCEAPSGGSTDSMGVNASPAATEEEEEEEAEEVPFQHPLMDQEAEAEVDALLVEVECKAFSQYRRLNSKPRKSKRYGHLCRNRPLEPSLDAIPERP